MNETLPILVLLPMTEERKARLEQAAAAGVAKRAALGDEEGRPPKWQPAFRYVAESEVTAEDLKQAKVVIGNAPASLYRDTDLPDLLWIQGAWAGTDHMTRPGVIEDGVLLTSAVGAYGLTVSEHMVALTMDLVRHLHVYRDNQKSQLWKAAGPVISVEGSRILILGMGDIGTDYARKVKAMGAYTIGLRKSDKPKPDAFDEQHLMDELDELIPTADMVVMVLPGGPETKHVMDEKRLSLMKEGAYLINVGRGSSIDQDALKKALKQGRLGGVALDVTTPEPLPAGDELWAMDNVIITPHVAGAFWLPETVERIITIACANLEHFLAGEDMENVVPHGGEA